ncbi:hypothetical protein FJT64_005452 [Amphibalanus amphitrite]|uniref:Uncharacterized protein n=1 Tax=Amphibalanus amphitrite TaxID=1232801 RepID=A0A6A4VZY7_AMPAM|nr:hypothetical protein FJT64_005452 [Amphibalanus amphitrite]
MQKNIFSGAICVKFPYGLRICIFYNSSVVYIFLTNNRQHSRDNREMLELAITSLSSMVLRNEHPRYGHDFLLKDPILWEVKPFYNAAMRYMRSLHASTTSRSEGQEIDLTPTKDED